MNERAEGFCGWSVQRCTTRAPGRGKPPARALEARTIAFRFAHVANAMTAAWVGEWVEHRASFRRTKPDPESSSRFRALQTALGRRSDLNSAWRAHGVPHPYHQLLTVSQLVSISRCTSARSARSHAARGRVSRQHRLGAAPCSDAHPAAGESDGVDRHARVDRRSTPAGTAVPAETHHACPYTRSNESTTSAFCASARAVSMASLNDSTKLSSFSLDTSRLVDR